MSSHLSRTNCLGRELVSRATMEWHLRSLARLARRLPRYITLHLSPNGRRLSLSRPLILRERVSSLYSAEGDRYGNERAYSDIACAQVFCVGVLRRATKTRLIRNTRCCVRALCPGNWPTKLGRRGVE